MPSKYKKVRFETEYNSSFKAFDLDVYRSPLLEANQAISVTEVTDEKVAGLKSQKFTKSAEPPLQHKRSTVNDKSPTDNRTKSVKSSKLNVDSENENYVNTCKNATKKKNRALELKAGLRPEASVKKHPLISEYTRQYEWKTNAADDSPLLNAEKLVFDSHTNIPRFVHDKISHRTEYQSKFDAHQIRKEKIQKENIDIEVQKESPPSAVKRLLKTSQNPDTPFFPHGSSRVYHSEYQANYGSPKKYKYKEGMWLGAKPPHLLPDEESSQGSNGCVTNWFEEVLELREKARHYKTRALEGNYFSREFLAKLDAEMEEVLGEESNEGSTKCESEKVRKSDDSVPPRKIKHAWGNTSGKYDIITNNLKKRTPNNSLESLSSVESIGSESSSRQGGNEHIDAGQFAKTYTKSKRGLPGSQELQPFITKSLKNNSALNQDNNTNCSSDASCERSEEKCSKSSSVSRHLNEEKCDKFNIETHSNDALSSSVQSIYGSNSDRSNNWDSDDMSSFASNEELARDTLSRATQRNGTFWKK